MLAATAAKSLQSCPTLCNPIDGSPPGSPIPGILQTRLLDWVAFLLQCMKVKSESEVAQSCLTIHDPMDYSLPGSSAHGIFQASILEWGAIAFSGTNSIVYKNSVKQKVSAIWSSQGRLCQNWCFSSNKTFWQYINKKIETLTC